MPGGAPPDRAREGVTRFVAEHAPAPLPAHRFAALAARLAGWRTVLAGLGLVGQDPARYDGAGYGNVSARIGPFPGARGARPFLISGTRTGGRPCADLAHFALVERYAIADNRVHSRGPIAPSSESMTHGAIYDLGGHIRCVLHAHSPAIWRRRRTLRLPTTAEAIDYGTPEMAREIARLARDTPLLDRPILAMGGHEDGVIAFGRDPDAAGRLLVETLAAAHAAAFTETGAACVPP